MLQRVLLLGACASLCGCDFDGDLQRWLARGSGEDSGVVDGGADAGLDAGEDAGVDGGTDAGEDAGADAGWVFAPDGSYNLVFLTSVKVSPNQLGSAGAADAVCAAVALDAGLPGVYSAWTTEQGENALDRTGAYRARGWLRVDGLPVADTPQELAAGYLRYPLLLDERGAAVSSGDVLTGVRLDGEQALNCADFSGQVAMGTGCSGTGGLFWTTCNQISCATPARLACLGVDQARALEPLPRTGRLAFVSSPWVPHGGLAAADAWCNAEAAALDAGDPFIALLATTGVSAASRLVSDAGWVRIDGVQLGDLRTMQLRAPFELFVDGRLGDELTAVFTGATGSSDPAAAGRTCNDWAGLDAGEPAHPIAGTPLFSDQGWFNWLQLSDCSAHPLYCVQP